MDRRHGAVVRVDVDKLFAMDEMKDELRVILAEAICKNIDRDEIHALIDEIYQEYDTSLEKETIG